MHEFSIAAAVVDSVLEFVDSHSNARVQTVRLAIGQLTHLEPEQLRFCYGAITAKTPLADSSLEIDTLPAEVRCAHCAYSGPPRFWEEALSAAAIATLQCPQCGKSVEATQGLECALRGIQYMA